MFSFPGSVAWLHGGRHVGLLEEQLSERRVVQAAMQSGWLLATAGSAPDGDDDLALGARRGPFGPGSRRPRWSAWRLRRSGATPRPGTRSVTATGQWPDPAAGLCGSPVRWRPPRPPRPRRQTATPLLSSLAGAIRPSRLHRARSARPWGPARMPGTTPARTMRRRPRTALPQRRRGRFGVQRGTRRRGRRRRQPTAELPILYSCPHAISRPCPTLTLSQAGPS